MSEAVAAIEGNVERVPLIAALGLLPWIERHVWILDHLDDVLSDLSAFHDASSLEAMESARFFALADRLVYYRGAVRGLAEQQQAEAEERKRNGDRSPAAAPAATEADFAELRSLGILEKG